ncbi:MAG: arylsulfotransferase family protein [Acidimicrobiales bacterium]
MSRREVLAGAVGTGAAVAALGLGGAALSEPALAAGLQERRPRSVRVEPRAPSGHLDFVTRPDLRPPAVAVRVSSAFSFAGGRGHIFCAPKPPAAANPGSHRVHLGGLPDGARQGLMIIDTSGELVWFRPLSSLDTIPFNFRVQTYKERPTLTWFAGTVRGGHATGGRYFLADDSYSTIATVGPTGPPCDLHEFLLTAEGTALHTAYEDGGLSRRGLPLVIGHAQEVDVATNELVFDWPCYPAVRPELSYFTPYGDYFHINSIDLWPGPERNLLVSSRNTSAVYLVDRLTGRVLWRLGGKRSDFVLGPGAGFCFQHDARALPDGSGVSIFDDASQPCPEQVASGKVLKLDQVAGEASLIRRYLHTDHELDVPSQGNCQLLAGGAAFVGWGFLPFFSAFGAGGEGNEAPLVLDGRLPDGVSSYRSFIFDWVGRPPRSELAFVVRRRGSGGDFSAWASWNGATEVASWRVLAGPYAARLDVVATVPKAGFETEIGFSRHGSRSFEAIALDARGRELGRSDLVEDDVRPRPSP